MDKKEIFIATPMYGGMCTGAFTESLLSASYNLTKMGYNVKYYSLYNESLITRARNILTGAFLKEQSDYLLFIDADQSFKYNDIHEMIELDKDILSAAVPMKDINWKNIKENLDKEDIENYSGYFNFNLLEDVTQDVFEVKHAGTGMMLIKREVLIQLSSKVNKYLNTAGDILSLKNKDIIHEFFTTSISEEGTLLSEDYNFCNIARKNGYKVYVTCRPSIKHYGYYGFSGKFNPKIL